MSVNRMPRLLLLEMHESQDDFPQGTIKYILSHSILQEYEHLCSCTKTEMDISQK